MERGKAKMDRPVPAQETYGDIEIAIKKGDALIGIIFEILF